MIWSAARALSFLVPITFVAVAAGAQTTKPAPKVEPRAEVVPPGPTMAETQRWLETEAAPLAVSYGSKIDESNGILSTTTTRSLGFSLKNCRLEWTTVDSFRLKSQLGDKTRGSSWHTLVPLKEVEVGGVAVDHEQILTDKPIAFVKIPIRAGARDSIDQWTDVDAKHERSKGASVNVHSSTDGDRIAAAIRRAAILCGAPASPF